MNYSEIVQFVKEIAIEAGNKILEIYNSPDFEIEMKEDNSPLTKADKVANDYIVQQLGKAYPEFGILSEESKLTNERLTKNHVWIVDPLDGTKEFIKRNGEFTVNIGLVEQGQPVLGVVTIPVNGEVYFASKGNGAYYQDKIGKISPIKSSTKEKLNEMVLMKSRSHASDKLKDLIEKHQFASVKESGSSIKICLIAHGLADIYYRFGFTNEWDICAAHSVLNEANGKMTDCYGNELTYNKEDPLNKNGFIASNSTVHSTFVEIAKDYI